MTQSAATGHLRSLRPGTLRSSARALHQPKVIFGNVGWLCVLAALLLTILGVVAIGTVSQPTFAGYAQRHLVFTVLGVFAAAVVAFPHYRIAQRLSYPFLIGVTLMLIFVLVPWVPESIVRPRNGARRWISLMVTDLQPSELAKIAYVLALASYLRFRENYRRFAGLLLPFALTFAPMGLILIEPDLGTAMLFLPTFFAMMIVAGAKLKHIMLIIFLGLALAPAMYPMLAPHQKSRIKAMAAQVTGDTRYEADIGYQGARSMDLAGAGGLTGVGKERAAALIVHNHLPEHHNDMIFSVIACRWGLLGAITTWGLFLCLCAGGLIVAAQCKDPFGRLVPVGLVAVIFSQVAINSGMAIGLMPITGMTLPFVSYGGSSLVSAWIMIGLLLNIGMRRGRILTKQSFEFAAENEVQ